MEKVEGEVGKRPFAAIPTPGFFVTLRMTMPYYEIATTFCRRAHDDNRAGGFVHQLETEYTFTT